MVAIKNIAILAAATSVVVAAPAANGGFQRMEIRQLDVADDLIHIAETFLSAITGTLGVLTNTSKGTQLQNLETALDSLNKQIPALIKDINGLNLPVISGIAGTLGSIVVNPIFKTLALIVETIGATLASLPVDAFNTIQNPAKIFQTLLANIGLLTDAFKKIFHNLGDALGSLDSATSSLGSEVSSKLPPSSAQ
ncbi:hypothetical protein B0I72DRAFT_157344 [Yarrowia lipolytica]|uniref:YALI0E17083p n=2 Tax=Yarrowia lipolytica TaxID=4952 RepID=Q6C5L3_YARLI|nr:YALI0E17083p [Yarrowia lipolytica CLIB122]AOW05531.1 hypothetical protein YALI1_E20312g [Yarrowia lipolytica]KAB8282718.1 hypothetical protein BKA91DRAFT_152420 [Yarrowia lipolytica]KAE8173794.1 hypothetical protein BKA90DRAFT_80294 [Yarrowia lipolytica]KAJ8057025.1 hypothetical protein LXG23DRAFT_46448 [Yarrowia lipolytica]QNQ00107.1 Hypothetical protein YALI2_E01422g [Yarrowia lipolytica]|eukprot:XP_504049.2 YALI0E17083p [Yarrowia lipolytica CLIB122]